jgi:hypothetical protein
MAGYGSNSDYMCAVRLTTSRSGDRLPVPGWTGYMDETKWSPPEFGLTWGLAPAGSGPAVLNQ